MEKIYRSVESKKCERGFTLIELVVAILVFSIGIMGVAKMQAMAINGNAYSMHLSEGVTVAQNTIAWLSGLDLSSSSLGITPPDTPINGNNTVQRNMVFSPSWTVAPITTGGIILRQVNVTVTWNEKTVQHSIMIPFIKGPQ